MTNSPDNSRRKNLTWLVLFFFASLFLLYHQFAYIGHFGYDDLQYAAVSAGLADGKVDWGDHFSYRWAVTGLTALSYKISGINDFASSLPALLVSLATLIMIFRVLLHYPVAGIAVGMALFTFNHWSLFYADKLMPDVYVAFFTLATILVYFRAEKWGALHSAVLFALMLTGAFLSKETVILLVPLLIFWFARDILKKKNSRFWAISVISGIVLLAGYFILIRKLTGDYLTRFSAILDNRYENFCNYAGQPASELIRRISYGLFSELAGQGMLAGFILVIPTLMMPVVNSQEKTLRFFTITSVVLFLSSNFMTITLTAYNPMCTDPRHYLFLIPVFAISGGMAVSLYHASSKYWGGVVVVVIITGLFAKLSGSKILAEQFLPILPAVIAGFLIRKRGYALPVIAILLLAALAVHPSLYVSYARETGYNRQKEFITRQLQIHRPEIVITDEVQKRLIHYYSGFSDTLTGILNWQEAGEGLRAGKKTALVINPYTAYLSGTGPGDLPWFGSRPELVAEKAASDSLLHLSFYLVRTPRWPQQLFITRNGFEEAVSFWGGGDGNTVSAEKHSGTFANQPGEYSATFRIPADTVMTEGINKLLIKCSFWFMTRMKTDAVLVLSTGGNGEDDIWESYPLFPEAKSFGTWSPVTVSTVLDAGKINPGSTISIYIWNLSRDEIFCDDWNINFSGL